MRHLSHTDECSTLLYPVSLLSQKPKEQYRDHLVGQLTTAKDAYELRYFQINNEESEDEDEDNE